MDVTKPVQHEASTTDMEDAAESGIEGDQWPIKDVSRSDILGLKEAAPVPMNASKREKEKEENEYKAGDGAQIIDLDVGGCRVRTTLATLTASHEPHSFFRSLLSGNFKDDMKDGVLFIDRDGQHIQVILNWLRNPNCFAIPPEGQTRNEVWVEADYYRLEGLCTRLESADGWNVECFPVQVLDDTRYPHPPRRFSVTLPQNATFGDLRYVICAVIGYQPDHFDLLIGYTHKVPRTADFQFISSWNFRPGESTLLRARGFNPQGSYSQTRLQRHMYKKEAAEDENKAREEERSRVEESSTGKEEFSEKMFARRRSR